MPRRYSLGNPAAGHSPDVDNILLGSSWCGGRQYGTTLRCSCGWVPNPDAVHGMSKIKVTNESPSKGGRSYAQDYYKAHLAEIGLCDELGRPT